MCGVSAVSLFQSTGDVGEPSSSPKPSRGRQETCGKCTLFPNLPLVLINIVEKVILMLMCVLDDLDVV